MVFSGVISFERPYEKEGRPPCGIYMQASNPMQQPKLFTEQLRAAIRAINASPYQRNMHALEMQFPADIYEPEREVASTLVDVCKTNGIVPIIRGDLGLCVECGAEGLLVERVEDVAQARKVLGEASIIGVNCKDSKEAAEAAIAAGADYVMLSIDSLSLMEWWSTKTHLPAVAVGELGDVNRIIAIVRAGAGFIATGDWLWNYADGPVRAIHLLQEAVEHVYSNRKVN